MKSIMQTVNIMVLVLILISESLTGQRSDWSSPICVTDSLSNNKNAIIRKLNFIEEDIYVFWEKSVNEDSTSIVYRSFYYGDEPNIIFSDNGVHYTNPQIIDVSDYNQYNDTLFYIFYESDETGMNKIYYSVYLEGGFGESYALTAPNAEQINLQCSNGGRVVWMEQDMLMHTKLNKNTNTFNEPVVIDSGNISFPSVSQIERDWWSGYDFPAVAYIKDSNDSSHIMLRSYDNEQGWLDPLTIFTGEQCLDLSFCNGFGSSGILTWDYYNDVAWRILSFDLDDPQLYMFDFDLPLASQTRFYSGFIFVKGSYFGYGISTFVNQSNGESNIFTNPLYTGVNGQISDYQNVSQTVNEVLNPKTFSGKTVGCNQYFINIWEEKVNGNWQLKYVTSFECLSKIDEYDESEIFNLKVSPNPINEKASITFSLNKPSDVVLSVVNSSGVIIQTIENDRLSLGNHVYSWNSNMSQSGLYFIQLQSDRVMVVKKVILLK